METFLYNKQRSNSSRIELFNESTGTVNVTPNANTLTFIEDSAAIAAIAAALYEASEEGDHDTETTVLTIRKMTRQSSPWSSKIYGLRDFTRK